MKAAKLVFIGTLALAAVACGQSGGAESAEPAPGEAGPEAAAQETPQQAASATPQPTATEAPPPTETAVPTPVGGGTGRMAFMSERAGNADIYLMDAECPSLPEGCGGNVLQLTDDPAQDNFPAWSPDGSRIAFVSDRSGNPDVYVMDADGGNVTQLTTDPIQDGRPFWSPDGSRILFSSGPLLSAEVWVMDAECASLPEGCGGNMRQLTDRVGGLFLYRPWSPDGTHILFITALDTPINVFALDLACIDQPAGCFANASQLTHDTRDSMAPSWSPDGSRVTFESNRDGDWDIYTMDPDGANVTPLTDAPGGDGAAIWSPDGTRIAFASELDGQWALYVVDADGANVVRLADLPEGAAGGKAWSPDGQSIAFVADRDGNWEIYVVEAVEGAEPVRLTDDPAFDDQPVWQP